MKLYNKNISKALQRTVALLLPIAGLAGVMTSCSDDHFDINSDVLGEHTIWHNIETNSNLSEYADILKSVKYSQTEEKTTNETYADLLNGDQTFTVWAPVNGSFRYSYYKSLIESGVRDSIYKVEKELIRNNMTRYAHVINQKDSVKLELFNDKQAWLNYNKCTIQGQKITQANIGSSNGVLHVTASPAAYQYNLYEYMASTPKLDSLNAFIKSFQKNEFDESSSTQGPTIDGKITWVDSVTHITNDYTSYYMRSYLNREDSNYVMVMPTNEAWNKILEKSKKYFVYKSKYQNTVRTTDESEKETSVAGTAVNYTDIEIDSLQNFYAKNALCKCLAFNANWQYEQIPITSIKDIAKADSLKSTSGYKFKKTGTINETNERSSTFEVDDFTSIFGGNGNTPAECSNGYAYVVNEWNFPSSLIAPDLYYNPVRSFEYYNVKNSTEPSSYGIEYKVDYESGDTLVDSTYKYTVLRVAPLNDNSKPDVDFQLTNVLSGKYDIYIVMTYNFSRNKLYQFNAKLSYDTETARKKQQAFKNPDADAVDPTGKTLYETQKFANHAPKAVLKDGKWSYEITDTICLARDFEFPVSYYGNADAYPTLQITSNYTSSMKSYYCNELWINAIILKAKGEKSDDSEE